MNILLVGAPNSGKTTVFNWLTGLNAKAVNYPGSTVEVSHGPLAKHWQNESLQSVHVTDSPGVFGLANVEVSMDEQVTRRALLADSNTRAQQLVVCVIDATQISRQLILWDQLRQMNIYPVIALTMADLVSAPEKARLQNALKLHTQAEVCWINGRLGGGLPELIQACGQQFQKNQRTPQALTPKADLRWQESDYIQSHDFTEKILGPTVLEGPAKNSRVWTQRLDQIFLHPVLALPVLILVMASLFTAVFVVAQPLMDAIDSSFAAAAGYVSQVTDGALWGLFLSEGLITGFGAFLVFVPQIAILFLVLAFLEGSGYLARTVVLMDRPFSKLGLCGRSLVPILVGFACAVPAMMATRTISSPRDRWITNFILPLMTCSARLPVFGLLIGFLFLQQPAWIKGLVMAGLYLLSIIIGTLVAVVLDRFLPKTALSPLAIELPLYRWPSPKLMLRQTWHRLRSFIENAAPVIFVLTIAIWFLSRFPMVDGLSPAAQLDQSYLGQLGQFLGPVFHPMGIDWRVGIAVLSAFAAREVFVATLALIISGSTDTDSGSLIQSLTSVQDSSGQPLLTMASGFALLIFFVVALQCLSTVAVAYRESGSWKFALGQLVSMNLAAYVLAVLTYQILS